MLYPVPRLHTKHDLKDVEPCGGMAKGKSHLLSEPGSLNPISWMVKSADGDGICQIRLSDGTDDGDYTVLHPTDGSADEDGNFPCGRDIAYSETKTVVFPDFFCDECTLQWIFKTQSGSLYQCADVQITDLQQSNCYGRCKNGGVCSNGICKCLAEYTGTYCQKEVNPEESSIWINFVVLVVVILAMSCIAAIVFFYINVRKLPRPIYLFVKRYMGWGICNRDVEYFRDDQEFANSPAANSPQRMGSFNN